MIIAPSLLACDFMNIEPELARFDEGQSIWYHLDIMDGHFVPNLTFGHPIIKKITALAKYPCDAHLMVTNPEFYIDTLADCGLHNLTFHYEATDNPISLIKLAKAKYPCVGLSIKPGTPVEVLTDEILKELDLVLVMSVEPGFGGQSFIESSLEKVACLATKKDSLQFQIQIDGGISDKNIHRVVEAGADNMVAGSYVFKGDDVNAKVQSLMVNKD